MKYIVDMNLEVVETTALNVERSNSTNSNFNLTRKITIMKINKILCVLFVIAACCFLAGTINHIVNTHEGWLSSLLLAGGCLCGAFVFYKKK